jgi:hypothetical protein
MAIAHRFLPWLDPVPETSLFDRTYRSLAPLP